MLDKAITIQQSSQHISLKKSKLIDSIFNEIFGDVVLNPMDWSVVELGSISEIRSGVTKGRKFNGKDTIFYPYLRVANVQDGYFELDEIKKVEVLPSDIDKFHLKKGDVLMTEGGDFDKLGRGAVWNGEIPNCIHQNHIFRVRPDTTKILPEFLNAVTGSMRGKRYFLSSSKQTTGIASINKTQLSAFPMPLPPLELQHDFSNRKKQIDLFFETISAKISLSITAKNAIIQENIL
jgi:type I restriction enzyme, S subunit